MLSGIAFCVKLVLRAVPTLCALLILGSCAAEEYGHLVEAGEAEAAHGLLATGLAPALFCSQQPASLNQLSTLLDQLAPHEAAVQASAIPWRHGAGLYTAHLSLQVRHQCFPKVF